MGILMYSVLIVLQLVAIVSCFFALGFLLYGAGSKEQKMMIFFVGGGLVQNVGYLLELTASTEEVAIAAVKMQYLGSTFIALTYASFICCYCHRKRPKRLFQLVSLADYAVLFAVFTCEKHNLYYREFCWIQEPGGHNYLVLSYGIMYYVFVVISCLLPYALSVYVLISEAWRRPKRAGKRGYQVFLVLSTIPFLALATHWRHLIPCWDPSPFTTGIMLSLVILTIWGKKDYDFSRMAAALVLRGMDDGVIMLDDKHCLIEYNPAAAEIFTELNFISVGDSIDELEDFPEDVLDDEESKKEFCLNRRFYECHVKKMGDRRGISLGYIVLVLDVTETKNYVEEIKQIREQAEKANAAKSEFLANMSHEIRTPMNAIVGLSDIVMEESRGRKVYGYAYDIKAASQNLLTIINDILDLSKVEAGKMELVLDDYYIRDVVSEVVNMMDIAATNKDLILLKDYDYSLPSMYHGDAGRLKQILINIMNNAIKFTKSGHVKISVSGCPAEEPDTELLTFRVEDTGCGIREEDMEKIFEDFRQVDAKKNRGVEGTGLGLSITKRLVQLMKGSIRLESVYGEGTTFIIEVPQKIVDSRTVNETKDEQQKNEVQLDTFIVEGFRILIVDDNLINRKVAVGFLKNYGFELTEAGSGAEAVELVRKNKYNMIFMDHMMPEMDGIEATKVIREECGVNGRIPIIVALTANAMEGMRESFLRSGFQDFISKPLDRKRLNEILLRWIPDAHRKQVKQEEKKKQNVQIRLENISIKGIDIGEAMRYHTGEAEDYLELLELYCMDGRRKCGLIRKLLDEHDYKNYEIEVHGLKSASANIGAMELSAHAREHEEAAARGDEEFIIRHSEDLLNAYERLLDSVENFLKQRGQHNEEYTEDVVSIDKAVILREIRVALEQLENFRSRESIRSLEGVLRYQLDFGLREKLLEIDRQLKMYEDDKAEELLNQLINWLEREE